MRHWFTLAIVALLITGSNGCVSQKSADDLMSLNRRLEEQVIELKAWLEEKDAQIAALRDQVSPNPQLTSELKAAQAEAERLRLALEEAETRLRAAAMTPILPQQLSNALEDLANSNPQLMSYDAQRGMVKLRSDLTFALGSDQVNVNAASALQSLAQVLKTATAQPYEVRVVGHTDNIRVTNPKTKERYVDNWGLSAFRSIAVKNVLQTSGVAENRFAIGGYADQQPIVSNRPGGTELNRRVEIYLVAKSTPQLEETIVASNTQIDSHQPPQTTAQDEVVPQEEDAEKTVEVNTATEELMPFK